MFIFAISWTAVGRLLPFRKRTSWLSFSTPAARWSLTLRRRHRRDYFETLIGLWCISLYFARFCFARSTTLTDIREASLWQRNRRMVQIGCHEWTSFERFFADLFLEFVWIATLNQSVNETGVRRTLKKLTVPLADWAFEVAWCSFLPVVSSFWLNVVGSRTFVTIYILTNILGK